MIGVCPRRNTTSADREWTDLPVHPLFLILLHESIAAMTTQANERPFIVGDPLLLLRIGMRPVLAKLAKSELTNHEYGRQAGAAHHKFRGSMRRNTTPRIGSTSPSTTSTHTASA